MIKGKATFKFTKEPKTVTVEVDLDELALRHARMLRALTPNLERDELRQAGTKKPRGSRKPTIDIWLDDQLRDNPRSSNKVLWKALPDAYKDQVNEPGFAKRATEARNRAGKKKNRR